MALSNATFSDLGGAVSDLFGAVGSAQSAKSYKTAAKIAGNNAQLADEGADIRSSQIARQSFQTIGGQQSDVAAAGFGSGGSAGDLYRSSVEQAALAHQTSVIQGEADVNAYKETQSAYNGEAAAAKATSTGDTFGSIIKIGATIASLF